MYFIVVWIIYKSLCFCPMNCLDLLRVYHFDTSKKIRLGVQNDGGYVIADIGDAYDCYISSGVSPEESFSRDFLARYSGPCFLNETN